MAAFPPPMKTDKKGKPMHSWRAVILPFLGEDSQLAYSLKEPWDGPHNGKLIKSCPYAYVCPSRSSGRASPYTDYVAVTGPGTAWGLSEAELTNMFARGSRAVLVAEIAGSNIRWAEPRDMTLDEACNSLRGKVGRALSSYHSPADAWILFSDGSVEYIPTDVPPDALRGRLTGDESAREFCEGWLRAREDRTMWKQFAAFATLAFAYALLLCWPEGKSFNAVGPSATCAGCV